MTPPPSDADKPGPGGETPDAAPARPVQPAVPQPAGPKGGAKPDTKPDTKPEAASASPPGFGAKPAASVPPQAGKPPERPAAVDAKPPLPHRPAPDPVVPGKPGEPKPGPAHPAAGFKGAATDAKPDPAKPAMPPPEAPKEAPKAAAAGPQPAPAGGPKAEPPKPEPPKVEPTRPGQASGPQAAQRPGGPAPVGGALTGGPIIDLKASRISDPPGAGKDSSKDAKEPPKEPVKGPLVGASSPGSQPAKPEIAGPEPKKPEAAKPEAAKPEAAGAEPAKPGLVTPPMATPPTPPPAATARAGFGSIAAAGLVGGVVGAGLLFAVGKAGGDGARLAALDQKLSGQVAALDQRVGGFAPRDALAGLDKRIAAAEATAKQALDKQALDKAGSAPTQGAPAAEGQGASPAANPASGSAPSVPADLAARLDSLEQRVAALQEEPGRDQPADSKLGVVQSGDATKDLAALAARVKALEGGDKAPGTPPASDTAQKIAALQGEVAARTQANAEADAALGQRLDGLQQALDARVKAATEAVQASRTAAEAQAAEAGKAVDRRLQEQADKMAALGKDVARRAEAGTVQAALRVVVADRVAAALASGAPYTEPLASLRRLDPGADAQAAALAPFAETGAPTAARLADAFRPIADRIAAKRRAARAQATAETGDFRAKLLSMADGLVQVRKVDAPAPETPDAPEVKVQAALERGDVAAAATAFAALPPEAQGEAGTFGQTLKARAQAEAAARTLLTGAFQALPAPAAPAAR